MRLRQVSNYFRQKENTGAVSSCLNEAADNAADNAVSSVRQNLRERAADHIEKKAKISPVCHNLRERAADHLEKKAEKMKALAIKKMGKDGKKVFAVGEIVQVPPVGLGYF